MFGQLVLQLVQFVYQVQCGEEQQYVDYVYCNQFVLVWYVWVEVLVDGEGVVDEYVIDFIDIDQLGEWCGYEFQCDCYQCYGECEVGDIQWQYQYYVEYCGLGVWIGEYGVDVFYYCSVS